MTTFKDFSANFAQSVCLLTVEAPDEEKTCTISSYNSVSASREADLFSFSLATGSYMAGVINESSNVRVSLLSSSQSSAADHFVKNRTSSDEICLDEVVLASIGFVKGAVTSSISVGASTLYVVTVRQIEILNPNKWPLVYRLRSYQSY